MIVKFLSTFAGKIVAAAILWAIILVLLFVVFGGDDEQGEQDVRSANASAVTATEAAEIVIENADNSDSIDDMVEEAAAKIDNAPSPEVAALEARSAICSFPAYRNKEECKK